MLRPPSRLYAVLLGVVFEGGMLVVALLLGWLLDQPILESVIWSFDAVLWGLAACVPLLILFFASMHLPAAPLVRIRQFFEELIRPLFGSCTLLELAVISLLAGVGEEMLFRGLLQGVFSRWLGAWLGLLLASILFGLAHLITVTYAIIAGLIGLYFGWLWMMTDNLLVVVIAHGVYDFIALAYLLRFVSPPDGNHPLPDSSG